jgi:uncharacterized membrane protein YdjX (TVP38/TMEM64 family)
LQASSWTRLIGIALLAAVILVILVVLPIKRYLHEFLEHFRGMGPWAPLLVGAVYVLATVLLIPGSLLTIGAGFVLGLVVGTITVSLASTVGASAAFFLGRTLARPWIQEKIDRNPKFRAIDEAIRRQGFKIVFLVRLSPLFPFEYLNYALGLTRISFREYVLASWSGMLPGTVMYVYLGSTVKSLATAGRAQGGGAEKFLFWVGLAATLVVAVFATRVARAALQEALVPPAEQPREGDSHV